MKFISTKTKVNTLLVLFFISTLLFPATVFNKFFFLIIIGFVIINHKVYELKTFSPFIIFIIFLFGYVHSFFEDVDTVLSFQFFISVLVLFLIYPIYKYEIDLDQIAKMSGLFIAFYTGFSFLIVVVFRELSFSGDYYSFFFKYSSGSSGLREFAEEGIISFHIGTVPFLYLPLVLYLISFMEKKNFFNFFATIVIFITLFISGSRGSVLTSIVACGIIIFFKSRFNSKIIIILMSIPLVIISLSFLLTNTTIFDSNEGSNSVKIGHIESFFENINFFNFFLGDGLGSYYYSKGSQGMKAHTEITPLDMIRYFGFILATVLYFFIIFPTRKIKYYLGDNVLYVVLFMIYVANSFTNPTMFNSYGLLVVLWYWYKLFDTSNNVTRNI